MISNFLFNDFLFNVLKMYLAKLKWVGFLHCTQSFIKLTLVIHICKVHHNEKNLIIQTPHNPMA